MLKQIKKMLLHVFLKKYKERKRKSNLLTKEHALNTVHTMLSRMKYCFLITHGKDKWCSARLVQPIVDTEKFIIWFGTNPTLRKVHEIKENPHVTVAISDIKEDASVILYGLAKIEQDEQIRRKKWMPSWRLFFPEGPSGEDYIVIRFEAKRIELMSFQRNIIPEPFGLKPFVLIQEDTEWNIESPSSKTSLNHASNSINSDL